MPKSDNGQRAGWPLAALACGAGRFTAVAIAFTFGALFTAGALVAALLEGDGFTSDATNGTRPGYVALLAGGLLVSIATPFALALMAYPRSRNWLVPTASATLLAGIVVFVLALT